MRNYDVDILKDKLSSLDWCSVLQSKDVNDAWYKFSKIFNNVINDVAPVKEIRIKQRSQQWFSSDALDLIWQRDQALVKFHKTKDNKDYLAFKRLRNLTQRKIKIAKREYIKSKLEENQNQPKKLWQNLKDLGMPSK